MNKLTNNQYSEMVKKASPGSKSALTIPMAFLFGGAICALGEGLINLYMYWGMERDLAFAGCSITLVFLSALLTGLNVYDNIAKIAGAGALVPITGFANAVASPALEFKAEGYVLGLGAKLFAIAGPVIVYGVSAGIVYGVVAFLFGL
ncbi:stage V sporulation protein AC [Clostridia bacterium]|nr:stage V sporulation protein AC [Clostridia bacterium]